MKIAILGGTGSLGRGLASRWIKSGHDVLIGSRELEKAHRSCDFIRSRRVSGYAQYRCSQSL